MRYYYIAEKNIKKGPFTIEELKNIHPNNGMLIWYDGLASWVKPNSISELAEPKKTEVLIPKKENSQPIKTIVLEKSDTSGLNTIIALLLVIIVIMVIAGVYFFQNRTPSANNLTAKTDSTSNSKVDSNIFSSNNMSVDENLIAKDTLLSNKNITETNLILDSLKKAYLLILNNYDIALANKTFDANNYFASSVKVYYKMKNLTPLNIDEQIGNYYEEFLSTSIQYNPDSSYVNDNGDQTFTLFAYGKFSCFRKSLGKTENCSLIQKIIFDSDRKIVELSDYKIYNLKFN